MHTFEHDGTQYKLRMTVGKAMEFEPSCEPKVDFMKPETFPEFWGLNLRGKLELLQHVCEPVPIVDDFDAETNNKAMEALEKEVHFFIQSLSPYAGEAVAAGLKIMAGEDQTPEDSEENVSSLPVSRV